MANVFLDLGTHYGQGLGEFIGMYGMDDTWTIHTFEANPVTHKIFMDNHHSRTPWVVSHLEAVSDHNGTITVNIETPPGEGETGMGTSTVDMTVWNPWGLADPDKDHFKTNAEVPCIDFSQFIQNNFSKEDRIIIKMDIEGSEFDTLDKMLKDGTFDWVDDIYVEWHARFFRNKEEMEKREAKIQEQIKPLVTKLENWR